MRIIRIDDLMIKVLVQRNTYSGLGSFKIEAIDENMLVLKNSIDVEIFNSINNVRLFLRVSGRWKDYTLSNLMAVHDGEANEYDQISNIKFEVLNRQDKVFIEDIYLARC